MSGHEEYLEWLSSQITEEHHHVLSVVHETGAWTHHAPHDPKLLDAIDRHLSVYYRAVPLKTFPTEGRGRKFDPGFVPAFWLDVDFTKAGSAKNYPSEPEALKLLGKLPKPSALIRSGGGVYPIWKFEKPLDPQHPDTQRLLVQMFNAALPLWSSKGYALDQVADLSRVLRLPGSFNSKYSDHPVVTVEYSGKLYSPEELLTGFEKKTSNLPPPPPETQAAVTTQYHEERPTLSDAFKSLCSPHELLSFAGFEAAKGETIPHNMAQVTEPVELFNPLAEEYPNRRTALLNPSGVVYCFGDPPPSVADVLSPSSGVTLVTLAEHLGISLQSARLKHQADLEEFARYVEKLVLHGELPPSDYRYTAGVQREAHVVKMAEAFVSRQREVSAAAHEHPFPVDCLPETVQELVKEVAIQLRIPPSLPATCALTAIAAMCMGRFQYQTTAGSNYPNIYAMVGAPTGIGKSAIDRVFLRPAQTYDAELREQYKATHQTITSQVKTLQKLDDLDDGQAARLRDLEELLAKERPTAIVESATPQLYQRKTITPVGVWLHAPEMRTVANNFIFDGSSYIDELLKGWSGDFVKISRVKDDMEISGDALSCVLFVGQPSVVGSWMLDQDKATSGMTPRFLVANLPIGLRTFEPDNPKVDESAIAAFQAPILKGYRRYTPLDPHYRSTAVIISEEALAEERHWKEVFIAPLANDPLNAPLVPFLGKHHQYAMRIAVLMSVFEWLERMHPADEVPVVDGDHMIRASKIMTWYTEHILQYVGESADEEAVQMVSTCLATASAVNKPDLSFTATDVRRLNRATFDRASEVKEKLDTMSIQGYVARVPGSSCRYVVTMEGRELAER